MYMIERGIAQLGRAMPLGGRGRGFESPYPEILNNKILPFTILLKLVLIINNERYKKFYANKS